MHTTVRNGHVAECGPDSNNSRVERQVKISVVLVPRFLPAARRLDHGHVLKQPHRYIRDPFNYLEQGRILGSGKQWGMFLDESHELANQLPAHIARQVGYRVDSIAHCQLFEARCVGRVEMQRRHAKAFPQHAFEINSFATRVVIAPHCLQLGHGSGHDIRREPTPNQQEPLSFVSVQGRLIRIAWIS